MNRTGNPPWAQGPRIVLALRAAAVAACDSIEGVLSAGPFLVGEFQGDVRAADSPVSIYFSLRGDYTARSYVFTGAAGRFRCCGCGGPDTTSLYFPLALKGGGSIALVCETCIHLGCVCRPTRVVEVQVTARRPQHWLDRVLGTTRPARPLTAPRARR